MQLSPRRESDSTIAQAWGPRATARYDWAEMSVIAEIRSPRGSEITCKGWHQEAALRMIHNNLDPEVAEDPDRLIVYGGTGRAARSWECFHAIVRALRVARKR